MIIKGNKGDKPPAPYTPIAEADNLQSKATARLVDLICEGEIVGLVNGNKSIFFNETPLEAVDGSFNFEGVTIKERLGLPDQDHIAGFPAIENEFPIGIKVLQSSPVVRTITDSDIDALRFTIRIPALVESTTKGDVIGSNVNFKIEVQPNGGSYTERVNDNIVGKTTSPYEKSYRIELTGAAPWNVKMTRITADSVEASLNNDIYWARYTSIKDHKLIYPDSALYGVTVDSKLFGNQVPLRAYDLKLAKIQVPSNYDPETRVYTGVWDGTFQTAWTDNPAWVFYAMLTNVRYGLGKYINTSQVDKWSLYTIGEHCDGLVDNGYGTQEPRFVFNGILNTRQEAFNVLQTMASVFRGMMFWGSDVITATQDAPYTADPVLVTQANVIKGIFDYAGSAMKARHSVVVVTWNDPNDFYRATTEVVEDPQMIQRFGWRQKDILAYGCTSRGQAHRTGKWILDSERYETEVASYQCSFDQLYVRPGDVVKIMDPNYSNIRYGGRIKTPAVGSLVLDAEVVLNDATYEVSAVLPDGTIETKTIVEKNTTTDTLTLTTDLSAVPEVGANWILSGDIEPRLFRILSIIEKEPNIFQVSALFHDPNKYARVEEGIKLDDIPYTTIPTGILPYPLNLGIAEFFVTVGTTLTTSALFSWQDPGDTRILRYEVQVKKPEDTVYEAVSLLSQLSYVFPQTQQGSYSFRVRSVSLNDKSTWAYLENYGIQGLSAPCDDVEDFNIEVLNDIAVLTWSSVTNLNLSHYHLKFSSETSGASWGSSITVIEKISKASNSVTVPAQIGTYLIKSINVEDVGSEDATLIVTTVAGLTGLNVVSIIQEDPTFEGTHDKTGIAEGRLILGSNEFMSSWSPMSDVRILGYGINGFTSGIYTFENYFDLSEVYTSKLTPTIKGQGINILNTLDTWTFLNLVEKMSNADPSAWTAVFQVRTTQDDPSGSPTWSEWQNLIAGSYTARGFDFRILLSTILPSVTPAIEQLRVSIDMPDRAERDDDITISASGTRISYTNAFKEKPSVALSIQNLSTGDYYIKSNEDETGFDIQFFNSSDVGISKTMDWIATGFGQKET